ncbi:hypothetical protein NQ314_021458 [Rhamnusium bicolor]|uniref:Uncharacterized protein n=1 Tax=Rhamnusium bicolor TaxID=1586634 RepID=A0AAV8WJE8_9CUCU|nr:hypothetical protein NQ314_021458 [Rhamnusium bicolor]
MNIISLTRFLLVLGLNTFIIPDELPSILSVIYSNIPTIKKGCSTYIFVGKSDLKIERSLKNLFEKLDNGDFFDLSDIISVTGDSDVSDEAEQFEENLINMTENCVEGNENKTELNDDGRKDHFEVA